MDAEGNPRVFRVSADKITADELVNFRHIAAQISLFSTSVAGASNSMETLAEALRQIELSGVPPEDDPGYIQPELQISATEQAVTSTTPLIDATIVTGESSNRNGTTRLHVGVLNEYSGHFNLRDFGLHLPGSRDRQISRVPSSTAGDRAGGMLGFWYERHIGVPENQLLFVDYNVKTARDPMLKRVLFPLIASPEAPWVEFGFPVVTDAFSTRDTATVSGRFHIATKHQVGELIGRIIDKTDIPPTIKSTLDTFATFGEGVLEEHWENIIAQMRNTETSMPVFQVYGATREFVITARRVLPAVKIKKPKPDTVAKTASTSTGKRITISRKARRVRLGGS